MEFDTMPDKNWFRVRTTDGNCKCLEGIYDGIPYDAELANRDGTYIYLIPPKGRESQAETEKIRRHLRNERDVVKFFTRKNLWKEVDGKLQLIWS